MVEYKICINMKDEKRRLNFLLTFINITIDMNLRAINHLGS